ncbi:MAG: type II secretion system protein [Hyphomicrobium sp.]|jgi:prepilin-type N-terminal cleavage/methylation domain-containing protein
MIVRSPGDAGFTLFEVIAALVIVSVGLAAFCLAIGGAYRTVAQLKRYTSSLVAARSQLDAAGIAFPLESGTTEGTYPDGSRWRMIVTPLGTEQTAGTQAAGREPAYWLALEVLDRRGRQVFKLQTAKIGGAMP